MGLVCKGRTRTVNSGVATKSGLLAVYKSVFHNKSAKKMFLMLYKQCKKKMKM